MMAQHELGVEPIFYSDAVPASPAADIPAVEATAVAASDDFLMDDFRFSD